MKRHALHVDTELAEGVKIAMPLSRPVDELDAELEAALGPPDKFILIDAQHPVEDVDLGNGRLANPDRADGFGFDERDRRIVAAKNLGQGGSSHPAGRATTDDRNPADAVVFAHIELPAQWRAT